MVNLLLGFEGRISRTQFWIGLVIIVAAELILMWLLGIPFFPTMMKDVSVRVIEFAIVAFAVFLLIRQFNRFKRPAEVVVRDCPFCVSPISLKATRCPHCTPEIRSATA